MRPLDCQAGKRAILRILEDPDREVEERLRLLLKRNANTEFGRKYGLGGIRGLAEYQERVPPVPYEHMREYVERMVEEDEGDLLFPGKAAFFAQTSGTSGNPKLFPYTTDEAEFGAVRLGSLIQAIEDAHPGSTSAGITFFGQARESSTPHGVPIGSAAGHILTILTHPWLNWVPPKIWEIPDFDARYYTVLRMTIPREVRMLCAFNPSTILMMFDKGAEFAPRLIEDLRAGGLSSDVDLSGEMREILAPYLEPAPEAAERFERVLERAGEFKPSEIWPELTVIVTWKAGMCAHYLPDLETRSGGCPIFPGLYSASEGVFSVPIETGWTGGVPALMESVLEFYPVDGSPENGPFIPISQLEQGQEYRMLLSNHRGLFRYPIDDVCFVETWRENSPVIAFSHRYGNTSSLTGEKLTESQINAAMERVLTKCHLRPREFQVAPRWGTPPNYVILVEFDGPAPDESRAREFAHAFDDALNELNVEYASKRKSERLGPAEIALLRHGEFEGMRRKRSAARGGSDAQVKIPRLVRELVNLEDYAVKYVTQ